MQRVERFEDIQPGDVGWLRGEGFTSDAIAHMTARLDLMGYATPSHSVLVLSRTQVIESLSRTVVRPLSVYQTRFQSGDFVVFRPAVPIEIRRRALDEIYRQYNGAMYGWGQILAFIPVMFWRRLTGRSAVNLLPLGTICSELVFLYLQKCRDLLREAGPGGRLFASRLDWTGSLRQNSTDPALLLACALRDALPPTLDGSRA